MNNVSLKNGNIYCMDSICNIQNMNEVINMSYNRIKDFKRLEKMSYDELFEEQNNLIPQYNEALRSKLKTN